MGVLHTLTTLIPHAGDALGEVFVAGHDHAALPRRNLLIGVERKNTGVANCAGRPLPTIGPQRLTRIFNHWQSPPSDQFADLFGGRRSAEDVDWDHRSRL